MRRIYTTKPDSALKSQAMEQFRKTRGKIAEEHPVLLQKLEKAMAGQVKAESEPVDQLKNLQAVMASVALRKDPGSAAFQAGIRDLLSNFR